MVRDFVEQNSSQPSPLAGTSTELGPGAPGGEESLLDEVFSEGRVAESAEGDVGKISAVIFDPGLGVERMSRRSFVSSGGWPLKKCQVQPPRWENW